MSTFARMYHSNDLLSVKIIDTPPYPTERVLVRIAKKAFGITKRSRSDIVSGLDGEYLHVTISGSKIVLTIDIPIYDDDD